MARFLDLETGNLSSLASRLPDIRYVVIAARGTSDNAAVYAKYVFGAVAGLPVTLATPSLHTLYSAPPRLDGALVVGISQSGESLDVMAVLEEAAKQGSPTLAITNSEASPLANLAAPLCHRVWFSRTFDELA